jgi:S1-C subfamily serine protease
VADEAFQISFGASRSVVIRPIRADLLTMVVPVAFRSVSSQEMLGQGTAFSLMALASGDALFATARHVVAPFDGNPDIEPLLLLPAGTADQASADRLVGVRISQAAWIDSFCDVALFRVDLRSVTDVPFEGLIKRLPLGIGEPAVGSTTVALGYTALQFGEDMGFDRELRASLGTIEEVHNDKRDSSLSTFPTFRTDGLYPSGMSGGPVLDERGRVIGVVSDGMDNPMDPGVTAYGYAAQVGALMELAIDLRDDRGQVNEWSMPRLARSALLAVEQGSPLHVARDADGVTLIWNNPRS